MKKGSGTFKLSELGREAMFKFHDFRKNSDFRDILEQNELKMAIYLGRWGIQYDDCEKEFAVELLKKIMEKYEEYLKTG